MTRKDYKLIAEVINKHFNASIGHYSEHTNNLLLGHLVSELADALLKDNPRFDLGKFCSACGLNI